MKISEINEGSRKVSIEATVTSIEQPREVNTKFGRTQVANANLEDDTGNITLVLWGDEINKIKEGDRIKIENGYVRVWNEMLQLSVGKFGKMEVI